MILSIRSTKNLVHCAQSCRRESPSSSPTPPASRTTCSSDRPVRPATSSSCRRFLAAFSQKRGCRKNGTASLPEVHRSPHSFLKTSPCRRELDFAPVHHCAS